MDNDIELLYSMTDVIILRFIFLIIKYLIYRQKLYICVRYYQSMNGQTKSDNISHMIRHYSKTYIHIVMIHIGKNNVNNNGGNR